MFYPIQAIWNAVDDTCNTSYPVNVKIERLRALHQVCDNLKINIRSLKNWNELEFVSEEILKRTSKYREELPKEVITYF